MRAPFPMSVTHSLFTEFGSKLLLNHKAKVPASDTALLRRKTLNSEASILKETTLIWPYKFCYICLIVTLLFISLMYCKIFIRM